MGPSGSSNPRANSQIVNFNGVLTDLNWFLCSSSALGAVGMHCRQPPGESPGGEDFPATRAAQEMPRPFSTIAKLPTRPVIDYYPAHKTRNNQSDRR